MALYTTGELARACGVSVRTLQFYDAKGLLKPAQTAAGGRRLYDAAQLKTLQLICMYKSLGFSLRDIQQLLQSEHPQKQALALLMQQGAALDGQLARLQAQRKQITLLTDAMQNCGRLPCVRTEDWQHLYQSARLLRGVHVRMLMIGIAMDLVQPAALFIWIIQGKWFFFAACIPCVIALGLWMTHLYHRHTDFLCPCCHARFHPPLRALLRWQHRGRARMLTCPVCGQRSYCIEIAAAQQHKTPSTK